MWVAWKRKAVRFLEGQIDYIAYILIASDKDEAVMRLANYSHLSHRGWGWDFYHPYGIIFSVCTEGEKIEEERGIQI